MFSPLLLWHFWVFSLTVRSEFWLPYTPKSRRKEICKVLWYWFWRICRYRRLKQVLSFLIPWTKTLKFILLFIFKKIWNETKKNRYLWPNASSKYRTHHVAHLLPYYNLPVPMVFIKASTSFLYWKKESLVENYQQVLFI